VLLEGLSQMKNLMTSSGYRNRDLPAYNIVLNQLRYRVPPACYKVRTFILFIDIFISFQFFQTTIFRKLVLFPSSGDSKK
jgi:hypothetical protein